MAIESERKFLVTSEDWRPHVTESFAIRQFYLVAAGDRSLRMRVKNGRQAKLTLKLGAAEREREEFEYPTSLEDAEQMARVSRSAISSRKRGTLCPIRAFTSRSTSSAARSQAS